MPSSTRIAVVGCGHGYLNAMYECIAQCPDGKVDLLIVCGDFEPTRNNDDLDQVCVPLKYRHITDFPEYYSGEKLAPITTIFIHGNHENTGLLGDNFFGNWICPNIYYMGYASVIRIGDLVISGLSGIYSVNDYEKEIHLLSNYPPYSEGDKRTSYHIRERVVNWFTHWENNDNVDLFLTHDWPDHRILSYGDLKGLYRRKDKTGQLRREIESGQFGNPYSLNIAENHLNPTYWFAGHMHVKYSLIYKGNMKFLALDKVNNYNGNWMQIIDIPDKNIYNDKGTIDVYILSRWLDCIAQNKGNNCDDIQVLPAYQNNGIQFKRWLIDMHIKPRIEAIEGDMNWLIHIDPLRTDWEDLYLSPM